LHPGDALGDLAAQWFRGPDHSHRLVIPLDDDLGPGLHLSQNGPYIFSQVAFGDVQRLHISHHNVSCF
jgi:hypothetical protein